MQEEKLECKSKIAKYRNDQVTIMSKNPKTMISPKKIAGNRKLKSHYHHDCHQKEVVQLEIGAE